MIDGDLLTSGIIAASSGMMLDVGGNFLGAAIFKAYLQEMTVTHNFAGTLEGADIPTPSVGGTNSGTMTTTPTPTLSYNIAAGDTVGLIQAIDQANQVTGFLYTINLAQGAIYALTTPDNYWYGPNGLPAIASDITINGNGATIERVGSTPFRIFDVSGGLDTLPAGTLTLINLTVEGGLAKGGEGGEGGGGANEDRGFGSGGGGADADGGGSGADGGGGGGGGADGGGGSGADGGGGSGARRRRRRRRRRRLSWLRWRRRRRARRSYLFHIRHGVGSIHRCHGHLLAKLAYIHGRRQRRLYQVQRHAQHARRASHHRE